jgi:hypothetical protein
MSAPSASDTLLTEFTPDREVVVAWTAIGSGLFLVSVFVFAGLYVWLSGRSLLTGAISVSLGATAPLVAGGLLAVAVTIVLHELVHAAVIRLYGGDVTYGVGVAQFVVPYAYVTSTYRFARNEFVAVALAPLVVLTAVGVPLLVLLDVPWLVVPLATNASGAVGDLWMAGLLLRYPPHVVVDDHTTGLRVFGRETDHRLPATPVTAFHTRAAMGAGIGVGSLLFAALAAPVGLSLLGVRSLVLGIPDSPWLVLSFVQTADGGFESSFGIVGIVGLGVLLGVCWALVSTPLRRRGRPLAE